VSTRELVMLGGPAHGTQIAIDDRDAIPGGSTTYTFRRFPFGDVGFVEALIHDDLDAETGFAYLVEWILSTTVGATIVNPPPRMPRRSLPMTAGGCTCPDCTPSPA
jgi:hypothetical protein